MIRLPEVNITRTRKTFASNTKRNENKFEPFIQKLKVSGVSEGFRHVLGRKQYNKYFDKQPTEEF